MYPKNVLKKLIDILVSIFVTKCPFVRLFADFYRNVPQRSGICRRISVCRRRRRLSVCNVRAPY